jgi:hypothetical protein
MGSTYVCQVVKPLEHNSIASDRCGLDESCKIRMIASDVDFRALGVSQVNIPQHCDPPRVDRLELVQANTPDDQEGVTSFLIARFARRYCR